MTSGRAVESPLLLLELSYSALPKAEEIFNLMSVAMVLAALSLHTSTNAKPHSSQHSFSEPLVRQKETISTKVRLRA